MTRIQLRLTAQNSLHAPQQRLRLDSLCRFVWWHQWDRCQKTAASKSQHNLISVEEDIYKDLISGVMSAEWCRASRTASLCLLIDSKSPWTALGMNILPNDIPTFGVLMMMLSAQFEIRWLWGHQRGCTRRFKCTKSIMFINPFIYGLIFFIHSDPYLLPVEMSKLNQYQTDKAVFYWPLWVSASSYESLLLWALLPNTDVPVYWHTLQYTSRHTSLQRDKPARKWFSTTTEIPKNIIYGGLSKKKKGEDEGKWVTEMNCSVAAQVYIKITYKMN